MSPKQKQQQEEHSRELLDRWNSIISKCEKEIAAKIKTVNEKDNSKTKLLDQRNDEIFRDLLWDQYRKRRAALLCSRCGEYTEYELAENERARQIDEALGLGRYRYDYEYSINEKKIINRDGLKDEPFYDLCERCQNHVLGKESYPLSSNYEKICRELEVLRQKERLRRRDVDEELEKARRKLRKEREAAGLAKYEEDNDKDTIQNDSGIRHRIGNILQGPKKDREKKN